MLEFKEIEEIKPNTEILEIIKNCVYTIKNGKIKHLLKTNLKFIEPTEYIITSPIPLTILEYKVNEISSKEFYIKEHNQKYNLKEIKQILIKLVNHWFYFIFSSINEETYIRIWFYAVS